MITASALVFVLLVGRRDRLTILGSDQTKMRCGWRSLRFRSYLYLAPQRSRKVTCSIGARETGPKCPNG
jgi:hypothetical protein